MRRFFTETQFKTHRVNSPQVINLFAYDSSQKCQKIVQLQSLTFLNHDWDDLLLRLTLSLADICCQSKDEQKQKFFSLRSHVLRFSWKKEDRPEWNEFQTTLSKLEGKVFLIRRTLQSAKRRFLAVNCTGLSCKGLWWWSSGQRARLLLRRSEFDSRWSLQFFCKIVVEKNENKQKEAGVGPIF